jgi:hypothetical protein
MVVFAVVVAGCGCLLMTQSCVGCIWVAGLAVRLRRGVRRGNLRLRCCGDGTVNVVHLQEWTSGVFGLILRARNFGSCQIRHRDAPCGSPRVILKMAQGRGILSRCWLVHCLARGTVRAVNLIHFIRSHAGDMGVGDKAPEALLLQDARDAGVTHHCLRAKWRKG